MMTDEPDLEQVRQLIRAFTTRAREELDQRLKKWPLDFAKRDVHEVVGALLARQVTLASQLAECPQIWTGHMRVTTVFGGLPVTQIEGRDGTGRTGHGRWKVPGRWTERPSTGPWTSPSDAHTFHRPGDDQVYVVSEFAARRSRAAALGSGEPFSRFRFPPDVGLPRREAGRRARHLTSW